jgi:HlyD family secretion protein
MKLWNKISPKIKEFAQKKKKEFRLIVVAIAAVSIGLGAYLLYKKVEEIRYVKVSGNIEGDDIRISFRVEGQIEELLADEGSVLKVGDVVARLNKDELIKVKEEAAAALRLAEYQCELDKIDYVRAENLFKEGAISAQQRDAAKTKFDTDTANVDQLKASFELARIKLEDWADLRSPLNGYVIVKSALQGEVVKVGAPVFTAIDLNNVWVTAYIDEKDLGKVKLNQKAHVMTDTYPNKKYDGWLSFISQQTEFTPKYIQTTEERVKYVYRVKVRVDNSSLDLKPGMPADAYILVE